MKTGYSRQILKPQISNLVRIRPVLVELFPSFVRSFGRTDGRTDIETDRETDITQLILAYRNFANANKNHTSFCCEI